MPTSPVPDRGALLLAQSTSCCRFEAMALEYDSDDIGELDNDSEDIIQGPATVDQITDLMTEFLEDHPTQDHNHEAGYAYDAAGGSGTGGPVDRAVVAKVTNSNPTQHNFNMLLKGLGVSHTCMAELACRQQSWPKSNMILYVE